MKRNQGRDAPVDPIDAPGGGQRLFGSLADKTPAELRGVLTGMIATMPRRPGEGMDPGGERHLMRIARAALADCGHGDQVERLLRDEMAFRCGTRAPRTPDALLASVRTLRGSHELERQGATLDHVDTDAPLFVVAQSLALAPALQWVKRQPPARMTPGKGALLRRRWRIDPTRAHTLRDALPAMLAPLGRPWIVAPLHDGRGRLVGISGVDALLTGITTLHAAHFRKDPTP
jgi:hypothetical protein